MFARDIDTGVNAEIHYSIIEGNNGSLFTMSEVDGVISVNAVLDREQVRCWMCCCDVLL